MLIKMLINTVIIIGLTVGTIFCLGRLHGSTTELAAIRNGAETIVMAILLVGSYILTRMDDKN